MSRPPGWWTIFANPGFTPQNYVDVLNAGSTSLTLGEAFINSIAITMPATIFPLVDRERLPRTRSPGSTSGARTSSSSAVFALQIVPLQMALVPLLSLFSRGLSIGDVQLFEGLNAGGSYGQVWIAHTIFALPLAIFLLHNFISEIPGEMIEAARVDGAGHGQIFFRIVLPLSFPAIASFAIFQFLWVWNDLLVALVFADGAVAPMTKLLAEITGNRGPGLVPAHRRRLHLDPGAAHRVLRAAALLRARPAGGFDEGVTVTERAINDHCRWCCQCDYSDAMSQTGVTPPPAEGTLSLPAPVSKTGLSIRSVLLIMLLLVSIGSNVVVGLIGYFNGQRSLTDAAYNNLIEVRDSRARELVSLFDSITDTLSLVAQGQSAKEAVQAFTAGFDELQQEELSEEQRAAIEEYFLVDFAGRLEEARGETVDTTPFIPSSPAESYLKLNYVVPYDDFAAAIANDDAGDGSAWSAAHAVYHDYFRTMADLFQFEDVLLIDTSGDIVYSAFKGVDLGANLESGALHVSNLAEAYRESISGNLADTVVVTDFEEYAPSLGIPAGWAATPDRGERRHRRRAGDRTAGPGDQRRDDRQPELGRERARRHRRDLHRRRQRQPHAVTVPRSHRRPGSL